MSLAQAVATDNEKMPRRRSPYIKPETIGATTLKSLLAYAGQPALKEDERDLLRAPGTSGGKNDVRVFFAGEFQLVQRKCVSIVGTREVTENGRQRAARLARELAAANVVIVSGLAKGVDTAALDSAIKSGGRTIGVIGTPLSKAYPIENYVLQETIYRDHLLMTPFADGEQVFKSNFPKRNRVMAAISHATVIVEASDTSGTLHQAAECQKLGRWLFIMKSVADDPDLKWPKSFLGQPRTAVLNDTSEVLAAIGA